MPQVKEWSLQIPVAKLDTIQGIATGWAAISTDDLGQPVIDHDGEYIPISELTKAAHSAFLEVGGKGVVGDMHRSQGHADLVESMVIDAEKRKALGFGEAPEGQPSEGWAVTFKIRDPKLLEQVKQGEKMELSIRGRASKIDLDDWGCEKAKVEKIAKARGSRGVLVNIELDHAEMFSVVDKGASGNDRVSPKIVLLKRSNKTMWEFLKKFFVKSEEKPADTSKDAVLVMQYHLEKLTPEQAILIKGAMGEAMIGGNEADVQGKLEAALNGLPEDKQKELLAAFDNVLQSALKGKEEKPAEPPAPKPVEPPAIAKSDEPKPEPESEEIKKQKEEFAKVAEELEKSKARTVELEKAIKRQEFVKQAQENYPRLPGKIEDIADVLLTIEAMKKEDADLVKTMLKAANEAISKSGILEPRGSGQIDSGMTGDAWDKAKTLAKAKHEELRKQGSSKTFEQVLDEIWREREDLRKEYNKQA